MVCGIGQVKKCFHGKKKKDRKLEASYLFFGEGPTEKAFLDYLHRVYTRRKCGKKIDRGSGKGGSHVDIVYDALMHKAHTCDYDKMYILLDEDCKSNDFSVVLNKAVKKIRKTHTRKNVPVEIFMGCPVCIEGMFLSFLGEKVPNNADLCKKIFHSRYLGEKEKLNSRSYEKIFPLENLETMRSEFELLDKIISVFE